MTFEIFSYKITSALRIRICLYNSWDIEPFVPYSYVFIRLGLFFPIAVKESPDATKVDDLRISSNSVQRSEITNQVSGIPQSDMG